MSSAARGLDQPPGIVYFNLDSRSTIRVCHPGPVAMQALPDIGRLAASRCDR
jgi:hypothetical protein